MRRILLLAGLMTLIGVACGDPAMEATVTSDDSFPPGLAEELLDVAQSAPVDLQVAVRLGDGSVWSYAVGPGGADYYLADIGSITKPLLAAVVLSMVDDGLIALDDPVERWSEAPSGVTVRQLLNHTSGIPSDDPDLPPLCAPGSCQSYSSAIYMLVDVVEAITGEPYTPALRARVLEPLGMTQTFGALEESQGGTIPGAYEADDAVVSTARDIALFASGLYGGDLLQNGSMEAMLDFEGAMGLPGSNECDPLALATYRHFAEGLGHSWGHGGLTDHFRSWMEYFPATQTALAAIGYGNGELPLAAIHEALRRHLPVSTDLAPCDHDLARVVDGQLEYLTSRRGYDGQPSPSPDGSTLAGLSVFEDGIDIVLYDLADATTRRLTMDGWDVTPRWSPDGRIIYSSDIDGDREIYVLDTETGDTERLTENDSDDYLASYSPDGSHIVFVRRFGSRHELWVMDWDGTDQSRVDGSPDDVWWPAWSPQGDRIVYTSHGEPFIISAGGGEPFRIPINQVRVVESPSWAPGNDILFSADGDIWSVSPDGRRLKRLTGSSQVEDTPVWGPDGSIFAQVGHVNHASTP